MTSQRECLLQIEELRSALHRHMGGRYDPTRLAQLVGISQELDTLVVEVTRRQWSGANLPTTNGSRKAPTTRSRRKKC